MPITALQVEQCNDQCILQTLLLEICLYFLLLLRPEFCPVVLQLRQYRHPLHQVVIQEHWVLAGCETTGTF